MRPRINERMRKLTGQCLRHDKICRITIRDKRRAFGAKEPLEFRLKPLIKLVVACGESRRRNIQTKALQTFVDRRKNFAMAGESKVIAAAKINKLLATRKNIGSLDLLQRWSKAGGFRYHWLLNKDRTPL